jgi:hypothetical protein
METSRSARCCLEQCRTDSNKGTNKRSDRLSLLKLLVLWNMKKIRIFVQLPNGIVAYSTEVAATRPSRAFVMETAVWALFVAQTLRLGRANSNILFRRLGLAGPGTSTGTGIKHVDLVGPSFLAQNASPFCARCDISPPRSH